ncbi:hypothetical protein [Streptomyces sp. 900105755]
MTSSITGAGAGGWRETDPAFDLREDSVIWGGFQLTLDCSRKPSGN